jgi:5-methylcytosine-specific restriction endonuclease McrA
MLKKVKRIKLGMQIYRRLIRRVLERDGWRCQKCGSLENLQVHHKIKRSQLGSDLMSNLVTLCAYCHMAEHGQLCFETHQRSVRLRRGLRWSKSPTSTQSF